MNAPQPAEPPIKIFGLLLLHPDQKDLIQKHCFGDCGKISLAGCIDDPKTGGLGVCCETHCPWLKGEMDEPYGETMSFGKPHQIFLRAITDTPGEESRTCISCGARTNAAGDLPCGH